MRRRSDKPRRPRKVSRYRARERDVDFMLWVKTLRCFAFEIGMETGHRCGGVVEADHAGRRGLGQKCADDECIPLCTEHHRQRTDFSGAFKSWTKDRMRGWLEASIVLVQSWWNIKQGKAT